MLNDVLGHGGDFAWALRAANDLLAGNDVYRHPVGNDLVSYPLPAAFVALPLVGFAPPVAGAIFFGASSMLLAWCLLRDQHYWWLLVFLAWPYWYSLLFAQWTALIVCVAFLSPLLFLLLVKPQITIPMLALHPFSWWGIGLFFAVGLVSLAIYPTWPIVWLGQLSGYRGTIPPILSLPFGPFLLLALLRYRNRYVWMFLLLAMMPQRVVYDQLALLLVARTRSELVALAACSWLTLPAILFFGGWPELPGGWQSWIIVTLYLPALVVLLRQKDQPQAAGSQTSAATSD
jgi:hypothetical protein